MFAQRLLDGGFTVDQIRRMAVTTRARSFNDIGSE